LTGMRWKRPSDTAAAALTVSGISGVHALYLQRGGLDFMIGDGTLRYGAESIFESYYSVRLVKGVFITTDFQHVVNPAFNRDRGPVSIGSLRLHVEWGN
ncbi:MAG: carbohydrate porin, partial [Acidobacteriota bacterium]|nr:carbohydrate porin [Acidobacteriota bacterium]